MYKYKRYGQVKIIIINILRDNKKDPILIKPHLGYKEI